MGNICASFQDIKTSRAVTFDEDPPEIEDIMADSSATTQAGEMAIHSIIDPQDASIIMSEPLEPIVPADAHKLTMQMIEINKLWVVLDQCYQTTQIAVSFLDSDLKTEGSESILAVSSLSFGFVVQKICESYFDILNDPALDVHLRTSEHAERIKSVHDQVLQYLTLEHEFWGTRIINLCLQLGIKRSNVWSLFAQTFAFQLASVKKPTPTKLYDPLFGFILPTQTCEQLMQKIHQDDGIQYIQHMRKTFQSMLDRMETTGKIQMYMIDPEQVEVLKKMTTEDGNRGEVLYSWIYDGGISKQTDAAIFQKYVDNMLYNPNTSLSGVLTYSPSGDGRVIIDTIYAGIITPLQFQTQMGHSELIYDYLMRDPGCEIPAILSAGNQHVKLSSIPLLEIVGAGEKNSKASPELFIAFFVIIAIFVIIVFTLKDSSLWVIWLLAFIMTLSSIYVMFPTKRNKKRFIES